MRAAKGCNIGNESVGGEKFVVSLAVRIGTLLPPEDFDRFGNKDLGIRYKYTAVDFRLPDHAYQSFTGDLPVAKQLRYGLTKLRVADQLCAQQRTEYAERTVFEFVASDRAKGRGGQFE